MWLGRRDQRLILDAVVLGLVGAASAWLFLFLLDVARHLLLNGVGGYGGTDSAAAAILLQPWRIPLATTLGGLLSGLLVYGVAPEAEGHGTDTVVRAFHRSKGRLRARIPPVKMIASAITIGSGGAAGREGPTALIAAGIGSLYGSLRRRTDEERRLLLLMAMAAGLSAVFRSPIGTAVFAVEVLYSEMEFDAPALLFTLIASVVAYASIGFSTGWGPLFHVPTSLAVTRPGDYVWYALLGIAAGIVAVAIPSIFYGMRDLFRRLPIPQALKPAVGGLGVGLLAMPMPQVLGGGYEWIQSAIDGDLAVATLLALLVGKTLAFSLTISSGGSGGVFAPTLYVGAMLGALLAQIFEQPPASFAVIGMAAVFAGAARVPIASLLMVTEMTAGYHLLAPAGLAVASSYLVQVALSTNRTYRSLYEAQVASPVESPAHHERFLRGAFHLLTLRGVELPSGLDHLQLIPLLRAGIPLDLPDGKQLQLGSLGSASSWVGRAASEQTEEGAEAELIAVLRGGHLHMPDRALILEAEDRLLFLASPAAWDDIRRQLAGDEATLRAAGGAAGGLAKNG
jgi:CIC family chloride channel protein